MRVCKESDVKTGRSCWQNSADVLLEECSIDESSRLIIGCIPTSSELNQVSLGSGWRPVVFADVMVNSIPPVSLYGKCCAAGLMQA